MTVLSVCALSLISLSQCIFLFSIFYFRPCAVCCSSFSLCICVFFLNPCAFCLSSLLLSQHFLSLCFFLSAVVFRIINFFCSPFCLCAGFSFCAQFVFFVFYFPCISVSTFFFRQRFSWLFFSVLQCSFQSLFLSCAV